MEALITVGEYIRQLQPDIFQFLCQQFNICAKDITQRIIAAVNIVERDKQYARIMQERPKPGRGGLLPGEGEDALW
jgi:hypothetical protein